MTAAATAIALALLGAPANVPPDGSASVRAGLKWLAEQQQADGHWEGPNGLLPTTITATAGLALLMEGSTPKEGAFAPHIRKAMAWLEQNANEQGHLTGTNPNEQYQYINVHSQALLFLACAYDTDDDSGRRERLAKLITKATAFLIDQQTERGGWGYLRRTGPDSFDDVPGTTAALQALFAVRKAGIDVPRATTDKGLQYFVKSTNADGGVRYAQTNGSGEQPFYSALVAACTGMQSDRRPDVFTKWVRKARATNALQQTRFLSQDNAATALITLGPYTRTAYLLGESGHRKLDPDAPEASLLRWSAHRATMYNALRDTQAKDGRWPDNSYGPAYATALALIVLQLDNGYLPAFAR